MESKQRLVLKHREGWYWSQYAEKTRSLFDAKWFDKEENAELWISVSIYAPELPEEYTLVPIIQTIEEVRSDGRTQIG